jgi:phosphohistidine phosphatase
VDRSDATRTLVLLRHAKSDWTHEVADADRPLAKRGRRQAPEAGRWLAAHLGHIDLAVVSPARRARSTWELVAAELPAATEVRIDQRVYAASADQLLRLVRELPDDRRTVALVGHNPGLEELVADLVGTWTPMPTSAIAVVSLAGGWASAGEKAGSLLGSGRPPASRLRE